MPPPHQDWASCLDRSDFSKWVSGQFRDCVAASGPLAEATYAFELGGDIPPELFRRSPMGDNLAFHTDDPVNLKWRSPAGAFLFSNVGGTGQSVLEMNRDWRTRRLSSASFAWQNRPLLLSEAIEKAKELENWLLGAGYIPSASQHGSASRFALLTDYQTTPSGADDWDAAQAMLAHDDAVQEMLLYTLAAPDMEVTVRLSNSRRMTWAYNEKRAASLPPGFPRSIFDGNGGYEWELNVAIRRPFNPGSL